MNADSAVAIDIDDVNEHQQASPNLLADALVMYNELYSSIHHSKQKISFPYQDECLLNALYQQALHGDCKRIKIAGQSLFERHKQDVWKTLKGMPREDATELFLQEITRLQEQLFPELGDPLTDKPNDDKTAQSLKKLYLAQRF
jgi:acyl-CoA-binding protein